MSEPGDGFVSVPLDGSMADGGANVSDTRSREEHLQEVAQLRLENQRLRALAREANTQTDRAMQSVFQVSDQLRESRKEVRDLNRDLTNEIRQHSRTIQQVTQLVRASPSMAHTIN